MIAAIHILKNTTKIPLFCAVEIHLFSYSLHALPFPAPFPPWVMFLLPEEVPAIVGFDSSLLETHSQRLLFAEKYFILISKYFHGGKSYWFSV